MDLEKEMDPEKGMDLEEEMDSEKGMDSEMVKDLVDDDEEMRQALKRPSGETDDPDTKKTKLIQILEVYDNHDPEEEQIMDDLKGQTWTLEQQGVGDRKELQGLMDKEVFAEACSAPTEEGARVIDGKLVRCWKHDAVKSHLVLKDLRWNKPVLPDY